MMRATSDLDDATSVDSSSPLSTISKGYIVQTPSSGSHAGEMSSSGSSPASPSRILMGSPVHSSCASNLSSTNYVSSTYGSTTASSIVAKGRGGRIKMGDRSRRKEWRMNIIDEQKMYYNHPNEKPVSARFHFFLGILGFAVLFAVSCFIVWVAGKPFITEISIKSLSVHSFHYGEGSDMRGVPTKVLTMNCSFEMDVHNTATFFGIHVSSAPNIIYSGLTLANGVLRYYIPRKARRSVFVNVKGVGVPLYGAGPSLVASDINGRVPLTLVSDVRSQGYVLGRLVQSKHTKHVSCSFDFDSHSDNKSIVFDKESCAYN